MQRLIVTALSLSVLGAIAASAEPLPLFPDSQHPAAPQAAPAPVRWAAAQPRMGGGFIEFLFGNGAPPPPPPFFVPSGEPFAPRAGAWQQPAYARAEPADGADPARPAIDPRYLRQIVDWDGHEAPGTIIIHTPDRFLYLIEGHGRAIRYGIGVGRPGFAWAGVKQVSMKREWPDWTPPAQMLRRRPDLPRHMEGGVDNPLGARAMYLAGTLYRIHGSNEPDTIGQAVSSGCIRMTNQDVIDLYDRARVGARVVVTR